MKRRMLALGAAVSLALMAAHPASATNYLWTFHDVMFVDGGELTGTFSGSESQVDTVDITTTDGDIPGFHYTSPKLTFVTPEGYTMGSFTFLQTHQIFLHFSDSLFVSGNHTFTGTPIYNYECYETCDHDHVRYITGSGYVSTEIVTAPVPEPAIWTALIAGFAATGAMLRRRRLFPI